MDFFSAALVVAVLGMGTVLIYLFKPHSGWGHNKSQPQKCNSEATPGSARRGSNKQQQQQTSAARNTNPNKQSTQHSKTCASIDSPSSSNKLTLSNHDSSMSASASNAKQAASGNTNNNTTESGLATKTNLSHTTSSNPNQAKQNTQSPKVARKQADKAGQAQNEPDELSMLQELDELDSSVLLSSFSAAHAKAPAAKPKQASAGSNQPNGTTVSNKRKSNGARREAELWRPGELASLIGGCSMTREEIELAVEALLNKLESGESEWRPSKGDPLQKLKVQLRNSELQLSTEMQNHEQSRSRISELKGQLQLERAAAAATKEELAKIREDLKLVALASEQESRRELARLKRLAEQSLEERAALVGQLEEAKGQLGGLFAKQASAEAELARLRAELEDKMSQLRHYELNEQSVAADMDKLAAKSRQLEGQIQELLGKKQHDDYKACARIEDLESDRMQLDKALKDQVARMAELTTANKLLEKSLVELQEINGRQESMLKRLRDERMLNEASMKRTLCEMELELKELHSKLSASSAASELRQREQMGQLELELTKADQREQRLMRQILDIRDGLGALLPKHILLAPATGDPKQQGRAPAAAGDDWVFQYLAAVKQLALDMEQLREETSNGQNNNNNNNNNNNHNSNNNTADKATAVDELALERPANGQSAAEGCSCKEHKAMESKLLELHRLNQRLELELGQARSEAAAGAQAAEERPKLDYEQQIRELRLERSKLEAQVRFGLDSLRVEQERGRLLELQLGQKA